MIRNVLVAAIVMPLMAFAQSSQPASTQPASTAGRSMPRYHNLMKNEFMKTEAGIVVLVPDSLKKVIGDMRQRAAEDRQEINEDIAAVTDEIRKADAEQRAHKKKMLSERSRAQRINNSNTETNAMWQRSTRSSYWAERESDAREGAGQAKADAARAKGDVSAAKAELLQLKKELSSLSWAASPYARNMPPRTFWSGLPEETKKQLARVGISKEDFAAVLKSCKLSDDAFLDAAVKIDKETRTAPDCADRLRDLFEKRMPPAPRVSQSPTMPPPAGAKTPLRTTRTQR